MIKLILLGLSLMLLNSCGKAEAERPISTDFTTDRLSNEILRLENNEVICYRYDRGGLSCKFKE